MCSWKWCTSSIASEDSFSRSHQIQWHYAFLYANNLCCEKNAWVWESKPPNDYSDLQELLNPPSWIHACNSILKLLAGSTFISAKRCATFAKAGCRAPALHVYHLFQLCMAGRQTLHSFSDGEILVPVLAPQL